MYFYSKLDWYIDLKTFDFNLLYPQGLISSDSINSATIQFPKNEVFGTEPIINGQNGKNVVIHAEDINTTERYY